MKSYFYVWLVYLQFWARSSASPISSYIGLPNFETNPVEVSQVKRPYRLTKIFFPGEYPPKPALNGDKPKSECLPDLIPSQKMKNRLRKAINICVKSSVRRTMAFKEEMPCQDILEVLQRKTTLTPNTGGERFKDFQGNVMGDHGLKSPEGGAKTDETAATLSSDEPFDPATNEENASLKEEDERAEYDYVYDTAIVGALNMASGGEESATRLHEEEQPSSTALREVETDAPEELERKEEAENENGSAERGIRHDKTMVASDLERKNAEIRLSLQIKSEEEDVAAGGATAEGEATLEAMPAVEAEQLDEILETTDGDFSTEEATTYYDASSTESPEATTQWVDPMDQSTLVEEAVDGSSVVMEAPTMERLATDIEAEEEIVANEDHVGFDIVIEDLVGVDELNFIAEVVGGSFGGSHQKDPGAVLLPTMGSQALFALNSYEKPASSEVYMGEDRHQMLYGGVRSIDDGSHAVQQFLVFLMSMKLSEFMQSCLAKEMELVDEAGIFQPNLLKEFFLLAFQDATSEDFVEISSIINECDALTKTVKESVRPHSFSVGCFDKKVAEFCSLRRKFNDGSNTVVSHPGKAEVNKYLPAPGLVDNLNRLPVMQVIGFEHQLNSGPFKHHHAELVAVDANLSAYQTTDWSENNSSAISGTPITMEIDNERGTTSTNQTVEALLEKEHLWEADEPLLDDSTYISLTLITDETLIKEEIYMEATPST